jgi:hypothetical protein
MLKETEKIVQGMLQEFHFPYQTIKTLRACCLERQKALAQGKRHFWRNWWMIEDDKVKDVWNEFCDQNNDTAEDFFTFLTKD